LKETPTPNLASGLTQARKDVLKFIKLAGADQGLEHVPCLNKAGEGTVARFMQSLGRINNYQGGTLFPGCPLLILTVLLSVKALAGPMSLDPCLHDAQPGSRAALVRPLTGPCSRSRGNPPGSELAPSA